MNESIEDGNAQNQIFVADTNVPAILCVDDDPDVVSAIEVRLRPYSVHVLGCYNGMQAFWRAVTEQPDLVITDVRMPQGSGADLLECLKRNRKTADIPVLVVSGLNDDSLQGRVKNLGAEALLHKPIRGEQLVAEVKKLIPLRRRDGQPSD